MTAAGWVLVLTALVAVASLVVAQRLAARRAGPHAHPHWRGAQGHSMVILAVIGVVVLVAVTAWGQSG